MMEDNQAEAACSSKSNSTTSALNSTDINELSKEKEDELLFGGEEESDDEDTLSDDSLRLRLSDDEEAEQEDITANRNISEFKSHNKTSEQSTADVDAEENRPKEIKEEATKIAAKEPQDKKDKTAIKAPESSALSSENTSKIELTQTDIQNSESNDISVMKSERCSNDKTDKELNITEIANACSNIISEKDTNLENDNLSIKVLPNNLCNTEQTNYTENHLKEVIDDCKETNICTSNKSDIKNNSPAPDSDKPLICKSKKLHAVPTDSSSADNLIDNTVDKANDNPAEHSKIVTIHKKNESKDSVKPNNINDSSSLQDSIEHKNRNGKLKDEHTTDKDTSKSIKKETSISLVEDEHNLSNVKDTKRTLSENVNNGVIEIVDNKKKSILEAILLTSPPNNLDNESTKNENQKNANTIVRRRSKRINAQICVEVCTEEDKKQVTEENPRRESGRQKRRTARNAEEIIRKKYLNSDSDFSDSTEEFVSVNHKLDDDVRLISPSSLKRTCRDNEMCNGNVKKMKMDNSEEKNNIRKLAFVEKFFQRNMKEKLPKLTQEELEELLIQKITETITMRSEIGLLREQARISERNQELTRMKLQQLIKQVKDFEMVLNRSAIDRRTNSDKFVAPIKINRSVGLQVNFITEHGIQNLRQVQQTSYVKSTNVPTSTNSSSQESSSNNNSRRGIMVRSPRPVVTVSTPTISQSPIQTTSLTITPAALVVAKPIESQHSLTSQPTGVQPILSAQSQSIQPIVINGKIPNQVNRQTPIAPKPKKSDLIDLTDEEEKSRSNKKIATITTTSALEQQVNVTPKSAQSYSRVIQTLPTNVAISQQNIKVISSTQPTPTAIVNSVNPPRLAYFMQSTVGAPRQVVIATSNANQQVRPVTSCNRPSFSTVTYKAGVSTTANGTVRVLATPASNIQINKHPAPLPDIPSYLTTSSLKLPPPAPSLKISKVSNGIVLSWNMNLSDKHADIVSYQLYAYQEMVGVNPSTSLWKKVGDVRALPLPMACTLTQFSEGNNYHFAVRAVDTHSRKGQYSIPGNISL